MVTENTIEEKIVERAQQKLKLDAMVVQSKSLNQLRTLFLFNFLFFNNGFMKLFCSRR
jgi:SNF2 family DNA or RNA helicase